MRIKKIWLGVLIVLLFLYSHFSMEPIFELMHEIIESRNKEFFYFVIHIFESAQKALEQVFQFVLSWKGVVLLAIYLAHKLIQEQYKVED